MGRKIIIALLIILFLSTPEIAAVQLNTLLTTEGLNTKGKPVTVQQEFDLKQDKGVQYYVEWNSDNKDHDVALRWFGPRDQLINFLYVADFSNNVVRDYISFEEETSTQYFIPQYSGQYSIHLYLDHQLVSITNFRINK